MRLLLVALLAGVTACSFRPPDAADPGPSTDAPVVVADAPAVTPPADAPPPPDMPPPPPVDAPPPNGQHCHVNFMLGDVDVSVDCNTQLGSASCQCFREGSLVKTCTSFSFSPCSLPTCCGTFE